MQPSAPFPYNAVAGPGYPTLAPSAPAPYPGSGTWGLPEYSPAAPPASYDAPPTYSHAVMPGYDQTYSTQVGYGASAPENSFQALGGVQYSYPHSMADPSPFPSHGPRQDASIQVTGGGYSAYGAAANALAYGVGTDGSGYGAGADDAEGGYGDVVAYQGGGEPYGARGTGSGNYWEVPSAPAATLDGPSSRSSQEDAKATPPPAPGAQRFGVKLLPEASSSEGPKSVICQVGLDGVRLLEPANGRLLRVYPLETITCWAVKQPSVFTFWARSAVDVEQRAVHLQSSEYTVTNILDALTAACVQLFEMVGKDGAAGSSGSGADSSGAEPQKKPGPANLMEWMAARAKPPAPEEKEHWVPDEAANKCSNCHADFNPFLRRHHCRNCGGVFCDKCSRGRTPLTAEAGAPSVRVCDHCLAEVTQRLSHSQESAQGTGAARSPAPRSHGDLAKKLQEEMERNAAAAAAARRPSPGEQRSEAAGPVQSRVLSCSQCGTVAVAAGPSTACPACGADTARPGGGGGAPLRPPAPGLQGPPHLWPNGTAASPTPTPSPGPAVRQVACPTCTVHLQVEVPASGTETVECGVCRHPFLVSA